MTDHGDAIALALLAGVTFRKVLTFSGAHWYYLGENGEPRNTARQPARSMREAAEAWLQEYESLTAKRMRRQQQLRSAGRLP